MDYSTELRIINIGLDCGVPVSLINDYTDAVLMHCTGIEEQYFDAFCRGSAKLWSGKLIAM